MTPYKQITLNKEELDKIKPGQFVKINNWYRGLKVKAITENYIIAAKKSFDGFIYSVIYKHPANFNHNKIVKDKYYCGTDNKIFGDMYFDYNFDDIEKIQDYLNRFESGELEISHRRCESINTLFIRGC